MIGSIYCAVTGSIDYLFAQLFFTYIDVSNINLI